jgi:molybdate transport system ATP-binding protein
MITKDAAIDVQLAIRYDSFSLDLELALPAKGITVLFGQSGCGKTSCLRAIAGLEQFASGYVSVAGEVWQDGSYSLPVHRRELGYVFQEARLFPHLSVEQNLEFGLKRAASAQQSVEKVEICRLLEIGHLLTRGTGELSGGERQRVAIARALLTSPRLLLMDEPLSALDNSRKADFLPYLERLHRELEIPVIYVTHSVDELARLADHVVLFSRERGVISDNVGAVMADADLQYLFAKELGAVFDARVVRHSEDLLTSLDVDMCADMGTDVNSQRLWIPGHQGQPGHLQRCRILASDVSITLEKSQTSSILNLIPVVVERIDSALQAGEVVVTVQMAAGRRLLSLLTRRSVSQLRLQPGMQVWAQIKTVAIC